MYDAYIIEALQGPYAYSSVRKVIEHPPSYFSRFFEKSTKNLFFHMAASTPKRPSVRVRVLKNAQI